MKGMRILTSVFFVCVLLCGAAFAQGTGSPPPPCCDEEGMPGDELILLADQVLAAETAGASGTRIDASDDFIAQMGLTRLQFLDRMIAAFFADRPVGLVISVASQTEPSLLTTVPDESVAAEPLQLYLIPRTQLTAEMLDLAEKLYVGDGWTFITIYFQRASSVIGDR